MHYCIAIVGRRSGISTAFTSITSTLDEETRSTLGPTDPGLSVARGSGPNAASGSPRAGSGSMVGPTSSNSAATPAQGGARQVVETAYPVEYKRGKARRWNNDDVQLCAQALCLEEMLGQPVPVGAVYHAQSKSRREVLFTPELRAETASAIDRLHALLASDRVPPPVLKPRCRGCSLRGHCLPEAFANPRRLAALSRALFSASSDEPDPPPGFGVTQAKPRRPKSGPADDNAANSQGT